MPTSQTIDWKLVVNNYGPGVWQTIYRLLGHHADACDCFQETFVSAFKISQSQKVHHWPALLKRLATARAIDGLRKRLQESAKREETQPWATLATDNPGPVQEAEAAELRAKLRWALARLRGREAEVFCLRHVNGMSYRQIAEQLGIKTNAVGVVLHRACRRLRALLHTTTAREEE